MGKRLYLLASLLLGFLALQAQETEERPWSVNNGTLLGIGRYNLMDTYLSPGAEERRYVGPGLRVMNERMKMTHLADYRISRQQLFNVEIANTTNGSGSATDLAGFADYSLGYHYHLPEEWVPGLRILAGGSARAMAGFIYNTRNGNNPASAKADIDLSLSAMAIYRLRVRDYPLTLRYQLTLPFAGVLFSPHYGQSYYEIFDLGNSAGVIQFGSFHNKFAMRNLLTVDFPIGKVTLRAGYLHSAYKTHVNGIRSHTISHSFLIGWVKEFVAFGGKRAQDRKSIRSAFY